MLRKTSVLYFFLSYIVYLLLRREVRVSPRCRLYTQVGSDSTMCSFASPADMLSSVLIELHLPYVKAASGKSPWRRNQELSLLFMLPPLLEQLLSGRCLRIGRLRYPSWNRSSCLSVPTVSRLQVFYGSSWKLFPVHYQSPIEMNTSR